MGKDIFKTDRCEYRGLVVDEDNPEMLARALERLVQDKNLCKGITQNAYERAKIDFNIDTARKKLLAVVDGIPE